MPNFRKMYGKIRDDSGLPKGKYKIEITNNYDVEPFEGAKYIVFS